MLLKKCSLLSSKKLPLINNFNILKRKYADDIPRPMVNIISLFVFLICSEIFL